MSIRSRAEDARHDAADFAAKVEANAKNLAGKVEANTKDLAEKAQSSANDFLDRAQASAAEQAILNRYEPSETCQNAENRRPDNQEHFDAQEIEHGLALVKPGLDQSPLKPRALFWVLRQEGLAHLGQSRLCQLSERLLFDIIDAR